MMMIPVRTSRSFDYVWQRWMLYATVIYRAVGEELAYLQSETPEEKCAEFQPLIDTLVGEIVEQGLNGCDFLTPEIPMGITADSWYSTMTVQLEALRTT